jgi:hypothetical protein
MKVKNFLLALLLFNVNTLLYAQNSPPDLSGTWRFNPEKSKLPKGARLQSQTIVISCHGESIQMRYTTDGKESIETYTTDGKEGTVNENQGGTVVVKAKWKGPVRFSIRPAADVEPSHIAADKPVLNKAGHVLLARQPPDIKDGTSASL